MSVLSVNTDTDITVIKNEEPYILTANQLAIYTFGAGTIGQTKTVSCNNRMHIWINSALHPARDGSRPDRAMEVMSSVWIIISGISDGIFSTAGSIELAAPRIGTQGRTWFARSMVGRIQVTVTVLEANSTVAFQHFLARNTDIPIFLRSNAITLPLAEISEYYIKEILDTDRKQRQKAAGVIDLTGDEPLHSQLESLHNRLLSLERKISHDPTVTLSRHLFS